MEALPDEGHGTVVHVGNKSSDTDSSLDRSKDGDVGAGEHGALLYSISGLAPLNTDSDTDHSV
jgi:hypothetical protein